jgi:hypothetical protein
MAAGPACDFDWITEDLAIGGRCAMEHAESLAREHGVGAVIDLRAEDRDDPRVWARCGLLFLHLPTDDHAAVDPAMIDEGVAFARTARIMTRRVLVHCEHGIGRSAMLVLCILTDRGVEPMTALRLVKLRRARVSPSPAQYDGWAAWLRLRASADQAAPPSYAAFAEVAYGGGRA